MSTAAEPTTTPVGTVDPMVPALYRVQRVRQETQDTFTLELRPQGGGDRLPFRPGQFNMLYVFGTGEVPISVSGNPSSAVLVHTTRAVGRVTKVMSRLRAGDVIGVRGPFGTAWPLELARGHDLVIVAGGIGLPPLRPVLYHVLAHRGDYGRVALLYGTRTPDDILFRAELERWRARFDLELHVTVDRGTPSWHGNVGVVASLVPKAPFDPRTAFSMICGPEVMIRFTAIELDRRGVPADHIYVSLERNMKCAVGFCGRCQFGRHFVCRDGPVFAFDRVEELVNRWEV